MSMFTTVNNLLPCISLEHCNSSLRVTVTNSQSTEKHETIRMEYLMLHLHAHALNMCNLVLVVGYT